MCLVPGGVCRVPLWRHSPCSGPPDRGYTQANADDPGVWAGGGGVRDGESLGVLWIAGDYYLPVFGCCGGKSRRFNFPGHLFLVPDRKSALN